MDNMEAQSAIESGKEIIELFGLVWNKIGTPARREFEERFFIFPKTKNLIEDLLFPLYSSVSSDIGRAHPAYPDGIHPGNRVVLEEISEILTKIFLKNRKIIPFSNLQTTDPDKNLILIGGPVSTLFTRKAMGYDEKNVGKKPETDLRFIFNLNKNELEQCKMKVKGGIHESPNYEIIDQDTGKKYIPQQNDDGYLVDNYLLINIMPNNLTNKKRYIINFSGTHDIGTRAIMRVLKDREILEEIKKNRDKGSGRSFQSLIHVSKVEQSDDYFKPLNARHIITVPIKTEIF